MEDLSRLQMTPLVLAVAMGLAGQVHASTTESQQATAVDNEVVVGPASRVATAVAPELYVRELGDARFESRHLELRDNGITVQSGVLLGPNGEEGALMLLRSPESELIGHVSMEGKSGLLQVGRDGRRSFSPEEDIDWLRHDMVESGEGQQPAAPPVGNENLTIDVLAGFTESALSKVFVNTRFFVESELETVNLSLRNSGITNVQLRFAGIQVFAEDIPVTTDGLARWQALLTPLRTLYKHDINVGYSVGGDAAGWAYVPGYTSVNKINTAAFKHEMGHNVGGSHCNTNGADNYKFGHDAGDGIRTNLCGNSTFYYSNPDVTYQGHKMGDARTANMARLWREQAGRLAGYSPAYDGLHAAFVDHVGNLKITMSNPVARPYFVANDPAVGPIDGANVSRDATPLKVSLKDANGQVHQVNIRGQCFSHLGTLIPMHSTLGCNEASNAQLWLTTEPEDNHQLPPGWYNGPLELTFKSPEGDKKILVSVSAKI